MIFCAPLRLSEQTICRLMHRGPMWHPSRQQQPHSRRISPHESRRLSLHLQSPQKPPGEVCIVIPHVIPFMHFNHCVRCAPTTAAGVVSYAEHASSTTQPASETVASEPTPPPWKEAFDKAQQVSPPPSIRGTAPCGSKCFCHTCFCHTCFVGSAHRWSA